jgi:hypothetical protein
MILYVIMIYTFYKYLYFRSIFRNNLTVFTVFFEVTFLQCCLRLGHDGSAHWNAHPGVDSIKTLFSATDALQK